MSARYVYQAKALSVLPTTGLNQGLCKANMLGWVTAQDNVTERRLYDDIAKAANWVTYERSF